MSDDREQEDVEMEDTCEAIDNTCVQISVSSIKPNPFQPRTYMDPEKLDEISASIARIGIIQPLVVRERNGFYELIAGERRFRGARQAGLDTVPVIVKNISDEKMLEFALIENMHREDLSPIDKALGFRELIQKFRVTQKQISELFHMSRASVANTIRLLELDPEIRDALHSKQLTEGHARSLLQIKDRAKRQMALRRIILNKMSVREAEGLSRKMNRAEQLRVDFNNGPQLTIHEQRIVDEMQTKFGTKVSIVRDGNSGKIEIDFYSDEDFERVIDCLLSDQE